MDHILEVVRKVMIYLILSSGAVALLWMWLKGSRDRGMLITRWALTAIVMGWTCWVARGLLKIQGPAAAFAVIIAAVGGIIMAIVWTPYIVDVVAGKIGSLYDGGTAEVEARPFYSVFMALRAKGKYDEARAEVEKQLRRFPTDFEGQMLLAELQAEHLDDLPGAEHTIERIYQQPDHAPRNISYALNRLADWYSDLAKNPEASQQALQKLIELLPDSEMALQAAQRIARLANPEAASATRVRGPVALSPGVEKVGLLRPGTLQPLAEADPGQVAAEFVKHLESHPLDSHVREQLAIAYARHYQRLDLAAEHLEQLMSQPHQPAKQVVRWLNLLADLQVQYGAEPDAVRATLQRIIDQYPDVASAQNTRRRLDMLNTELKVRDTGRHDVKLGSYEQNIGLKRGV